MLKPHTHRTTMFTTFSSVVFSIILSKFFNYFVYAKSTKFFIRRKLEIGFSTLSECWIFRIFCIAFRQITGPSNQLGNTLQYCPTAKSIFAKLAGLSVVFVRSRNWLAVGGGTQIIPTAIRSHLVDTNNYLFRSLSDERPLWIISKQTRIILIANINLQFIDFKFVKFLYRENGEQAVHYLES